MAKTEPEKQPPAAPASTAPARPASHDESTFVAKRARVPGYDLRELIGRGGMGEVWRGVQLSLNRTVAVKVLAEKLAAEQEFVARFEKEAAALATLSHPNIVSIIDRGHAEGTWYFVMEHVDGVSLREVMNERRLGMSDALRVVAQVCNAIDYAHQRGIIHRDLKPENILLTREGQAKVADFGLAGIAAGEQRFNVTRTSVAMGTLNYMAPEQRRDAKSVDGRADLYSLGVVLYELLTGEVPVGRFKLPSEKVHGLDARLDDIVSKALESEPEARFQKASEIGRALEGLISTRTGASSADLPPLPLPATKTERRETQVSSSDYAKAFWRTLSPGKKAALVVIGVAMVTAATRYAYWRLRSPDTAISKLARSSARFVGLNLDEEESKQGVVEEDHHIISAVQVKDDGDRESLAFAFTPAAEGQGKELHCHRGEWKLEGDALVMDAFASPPSDDPTPPRAYVEDARMAADGFEADVEVNLDLRPGPGGKPVKAGLEPQAELFLRHRESKFQLAALLGDEPAFMLGYRYENAEGKTVEDDIDLEGAPTPQPNRAYKLGLRLRGNVLTALVDGQVVHTEKLKVSAEHAWGVPGVGCQAARCRFRALSASGRLAGREEPVAQKPRHGPAGPNP